MREITVFLSDGTIATHQHGDSLLDTDEGTLIITTDGQSTYTFNWDKCLCIVESPWVEAPGV